MSVTTRRRCALIGASVLSVVGAVALGCLLTDATAGATQTARVDGHYRIVSTDCYFGAGACHTRFDIEQKGTLLSVGADPLFHGHVNGDHVYFGEFFPPGTSEDSWSALGTTADHGRTVVGTMHDGLGGSGTFTLTYLGP